MASAEKLKQIFNPAFGGGDFYTALDSTTLPSGATQYIQNTLTPTNATQKFSVQQGSYSVAGFIMTDPTFCQWNTTISATGVLTTSLIPGSCPTVASFVPCVKGQPIGLLVGITCP